MFFPFYWPLWYLELCTGNTSLPSLREISRRAVRACNSISLGAKGATCVCVLAKESMEEQLGLLFEL